MGIEDGQKGRVNGLNKSERYAKIIDRECIKTWRKEKRTE